MLLAWRRLEGGLSQSSDLALLDCPGLESLKTSDPQIQPRTGLTNLSTYFIVVQCQGPSQRQIQAHTYLQGTTWRLGRRTAEVHYSPGRLAAWLPKGVLGALLLSAQPSPRWGMGVLFGWENQLKVTG